MDEAAFRCRTMNLGLEAIRPVADLPPEITSQVIRRQLLRSATSVGANYRAACRARSVADMISKLSIVEEKADEITRMVVASKKTLKSRAHNDRSPAGPPPNRK